MSEESKYFIERDNQNNESCRNYSKSIQSCESIEIRPSGRRKSIARRPLDKFESDSNSSDADLVEQNDASNKMNSYNRYSSDNLLSRFSLQVPGSMLKDESVLKRF